ncbi:hypothetical protein D9619_000287 [Psilocybe cf. subviscida]|uniref:Uncharacterized protein n=1 Tax=Psilocybe cf. subviscida TaxID=2480587 RepID=A0A8H5BE27_9AGAR|nr:hypothetical protein D9619_000287 [Psilocybe cf. subviscida]
MSPHTCMAVINNDQLLYLSNGKIHLYLEDFNTWHIFESDVPSHMICVDKGKGMYKMDVNKEIWEYNTAKSRWINISIDGNPDSERSETQSILASNGQIYQLQVDGAIWVYDAPAGKWETLDPKSQKKRCIAADGIGKLYQLHMNGSIWQYNGPRVKGWTIVDNPCITNKLVAGAGGAYLTHADGATFKFDDGRKAWDCIDRNALMLQNAVGRAGLFQRHKDKVLRYSGNAGVWTPVPNDPTDDLVVGDSTVYVKHPDGRVSKYRNSPCNWFKLPPVP